MFGGQMEQYSAVAGLEFDSQPHQISNTSKNLGIGIDLPAERGE